MQKRTLGRTGHQSTVATLEAQTLRCQPRKTLASCFCAFEVVPILVEIVEAPM